MRAVMVERTGGPDVLEVQQVKTPEPEPGQLLVDVAAAGVNFVDIYEREGIYRRSTPFMVGSEGAGVVAAVGSSVKGVQVGDRVAWAMVPGGGYAEQVVVPADRAVPVPDEVDLETAAAVLLQGMTAHFLCESTYPVAPGKVALVHAAAGGVGRLLTQMIVAKGGRVIATVSTPEKAEDARAAGAADVILYTREDLVGAVDRITEGRGVDVVFDGVGAATFAAGLDCLVPRGMMVLFGAASGPVPPLDPQVLNRKGSLFLTRPSLKDYAAKRPELKVRAQNVFAQVANGSLSVHVGGRYSLEDARRAQQDLASRRTTGKLLIVP